jgi:hypothetical protein
MDKEVYSNASFYANAVLLSLLDGFIDFFIGDRGIGL